MKRKEFLRGGALAFGGLLLNPFRAKANTIKEEFGSRKAKNIIFMVSDGMSSGTLNMADLYSRRKLGKPSHWISLYEESLVNRGVMDMASLNSIVTDSAAASSSWGILIVTSSSSLIKPCELAPAGILSATFPIPWQVPQ